MTVRKALYKAPGTEVSRASLAREVDAMISGHEGGTIVNLLSDVSEVIELFDALIAGNMGAGRFPLILTNFVITSVPLRCRSATTLGIHTIAAKFR